MEKHFYNDDLNKFEALNETCNSIYELGDAKVLIILKDGTNVSDYLDIEKPEEVIYISEDLSGRTNLERYYYLGQVFERVYREDLPVFVRYTENPFKNIRAMVVRNVSADVTSLNDMFRGLKRLKTVSGLESWNVGNVRTMDSLFIECCNLKTISGMGKWNVGNVYDMTWAFNECVSLEDISDLKNWDVSNVKSVRGMFKYCNGLNDISPVESWNLKPGCDTKNMFYDTRFEGRFKSAKPELKRLPGLERSNLKQGLVCEKCGSTNLVLGGGEITCGECNNLIKSHLELKCPDCGSNDIKYTRLHDLECRRCRRIILENVHFNSIINWK